MQPTRPSPFAHLRNDLPASVVVFLVAIPLCLGIAVASGAPALSGLIAGIVGGIVVGIASGSPLGVTGPAAGLTAVVLTAISDLGSFQAFLSAVVMAGVLQVVLGFLRGGVIAYYFPNAVIKGMLAGIGVIIILKQLPHALGDDKDYMGDEGFEQPDKLNTFTELWYALFNIHWGALVIAASCLAVMLLWERPFIRRLGFLRYIPGPLLAVLAGIGMAAGFEAVPSLRIGPGHYVDLPDITGWSSLPHPDFGAWADPRTWAIALTLAVVASLETLLCVEATDKMDPWHRTTPANRELHAQGVGNIISGLLGGLPMTQVIVRSSANIQSGGRTKLSTILHGSLLLVSALVIPGALRSIPLAALAAVLLMVGYKLVKPAQFKSMWKAGIMQFLPFTVTVVGVAFTDLLTGVGLGLAVAVVHILWKNYKVPFHFDPHRYKPGMPIYIELSEDVTFLNKASIKRTLSEIPDGARVVIDGGRSFGLDPDVREIIDDFAKTAEGRRIRLQLMNMPVRPGEEPAPVPTMLAEPRT